MTTCVIGMLVGLLLPAIQMVRLAALNQLTHRCHILEAKGESYRLQDARRRQRRTAPTA